VKDIKHNRQTEGGILSRTDRQR